MFDVEGRRFERHVAVPSLDRIDDVVITPDGSTLVACGAGELVILDPDGFQPRRAPIDAGPDDLYCNLAVSRDSSLVSANSGLVAFGVNGEIRVIRLADGTLAGPPIPVPGDVQAPAVFSADGRRIAKAMFPDGARQWDVETGEPVGPTLLIPETSVGPAPGDSPSAVAYDPPGRYLAVGDTTGRVRFFSTDELEPAGPSFDTGEDEVSVMAFSSDGSRLAVGTATGDVQIFDVERQRSITPLLAGQGTQISGLSFSDRDRTVLASSGDGTIAIYDAGGRTRHGSCPRLWLAAGASRDRNGGQPRRPACRGHAPRRGSHRLEPGHRRARRPTASHSTPRQPELPSALTAAGWWPAMDIGDLTTWATDTWQTIGPSIAGPGYSLVPGLVFSPDGGVLAAAQDVPPTIRFYDAATHRPIGDPIRLPRREESQPVPMRGHGFSPDGSTLLTVELYASEVRIWDVATREEIQTLSGFEGAVTTATFDPTGKRIAVGETSGSVEIVDVESGRIIGDPYRGPQRRDRPRAIQPRRGPARRQRRRRHSATLGHSHRTCARTKTAFDIETPYREATVRFSPDGAYLLTAGRNGDVIAWDLDPTRLAEHACRLAGRNLTRAEWERYMPDRISYRRTCNQWPEAPSD